MYPLWHVKHADKKWLIKHSNEDTVAGQRTNSRFLQGQSGFWQQQEIWERENYKNMNWQSAAIDITFHIWHCLCKSALSDMTLSETGVVWAKPWCDMFSELKLFIQALWQLQLLSVFTCPLVSWWWSCFFWSILFMFGTWKRHRLVSEIWISPHPSFETTGCATWST